MKKITRYGISALLAVLCLTGCLKDDTQSPCGAAQTGGIRLTLAIGDMRDEEIVTRSAVSTQECTITKLSVLLFDKSTGKFKESEEIDIRTQLSGSNGDKLRTLTVNLSPAVGDKIVIVANYEQNGTLTEGNSTTADINSVYKSSFNSEFMPFDEGLPMSGETTYSDSGVTCWLYHSVAKVQVRLADGLTLDGQAVTTDNSSWGIGNYLLVTSALVYGQPTGTIALNPGIKESDFTDRTPQNTIDDASSQDESVMNRGYLVEYPNAKYAKQQEVDITEFDAGRTCVFLRLRGFDAKSRDNYYRLDFSRQLRSTGLDQGASNEFLDIRRNTHYVFLITKIKSRGYRTQEEALANPGSNIEYTVTVEDGEWESISSNGQYAVKTDRDSCFLMQNVAEPADLLKFAVQMPDAGQKPGDDLPGSIKTCRVSLVGEDKNTLVPSEQLQLCTTDGTSYSAIDFTSEAIPIPDEGYQLKYKAGTTAPSEQCYVKIEYGNIRHYVPVGIVTFNVTADKTETDYKGGTLPLTVESYAMFGTKRVELNWRREFENVAEVSSWVSLPENGVSGTVNAIIQEQKGYISNPHNDVLQAAFEDSDLYDLSTNGGTRAMNTANCYVINRPGKFSLPLVYGNAIKNGQTNSSAYISTASGANVLQTFVNHLNASITDPYIYNNAGCTPVDAILVWEDEKDLVTNVRLASDKKTLTFNVPASSIRQGNAVVAVRDVNKKIMWSWHIWVTDFRLDGNVAPVDHYDPTLKQEDRYVTINSNEAYRFMGVNLGWCDAGILNYDARSGSVLFKQALTGAVRKITVGQTDYTVAISGNQPYYQHGRKDPLLPIVVKDNQIIDKHCYSNDGYAFNASGKGAVPIGQAIQTPHVFYNYNTSNTNDWCNPAGTVSGKSTFFNLWSTNNTSSTGGGSVVKTIYDPSPVGYCLPTPTAVKGFSYNGGNASGNYFGSKFNSPYTSEADFQKNHGWVFYCYRMKAVGSYDLTGGVLFYPALGCRFSSTGLPYGVQEYCYYWSCVSYGTRYAKSSLEATVNYQRALGFPIRPVREN